MLPPYEIKIYILQNTLWKLTQDLRIQTNHIQRQRFPSNLTSFQIKFIFHFINLIHRDNQVRHDHQRNRTHIFHFHSKKPINFSYQTCFAFRIQKITVIIKILQNVQKDCDFDFCDGFYNKSFVFGKEKEAAASATFVGVSESAGFEDLMTVVFGVERLDHLLDWYVV